MPRLRETPEVRRRQLIDAAMRSIAKYGYAGTTIETICDEAKVSRGLINHHFGSKEELIRQSYKALRDEWMAQTHGSLLANYDEPEDKLKAMIRVSFGPTMFKTEYLGIWAGFWSAIGKSPALRKLNRELFEKDREAYQEIFEAIAYKRGKKVDSRRAALSVIALIDGFWLEWCLDPKGFTAEEAEDACLSFVAQTFA
ncbi:MAG: transcriptional regulator BetI [Gammaproteobacteria bacterium]|nr:transcriptional regulator BetI [Gammaproteobacteria bacterium]